MKRRELAWAKDFVRSLEWRFSKTMPQWPHWYIVRGEDNRRSDFDRLVALVERYGEDDIWGKKPRRYLRIGDYKYWVLGDIVNRAAPIPSAEVRRRGELWLQQHGKMIGPDGNLIPAKSKGRGRAWKREMTGANTWLTTPRKTNMSGG